MNKVDATLFVDGIRRRCQMMKGNNARTAILVLDERDIEDLEALHDWVSKAVPAGQAPQRSSWGKGR